MAPARFLSVRRRFWLPRYLRIHQLSNSSPLVPGPDQEPQVPDRFSTSGGDSLLRAFRRDSCPSLKDPTIYQGWKCRRKLWTCLSSVPRVDQLRAMFTRLHRTRQAVATTHSHPTTVNCVNRVNCHQSRYSPMCSSSSPQRVTTTADWN